ncbi:MAG: hypothetical protein V1810_01020 [Candidatus Beckwithbacteria bacterium]
MSRKNRQLILILISGWLGLLLIQWLTPAIWGADGWFHIRLAEMMKHQGFLKTLPLAELSYFNDRFSDKDWLYHLLLIPFTLGKNIFSGAKWAAWISSGVLFSSLILVGKKYLTWPWLVIAGSLFFSSDHFLRAVMESRPIVLTLALSLWLIHWLIQKKGNKVFWASFVYGWLHITAPLAAVYGVLAKRWKLAVVVGLGVLLSQLIYPNFPNNLFYFYLNGLLVPWFAFRWNVLELGAEFFPLSWQQYLAEYGVIVLGILVTGASLIWLKPKLNYATKVWLIISTIFLIMGFKSQRYIVHGFGFFILSSTMIWAASWQKVKKYSNGIILLGTVVIFLLLGRSLQQIILRSRGETMFGNHYAQVGQWLKENTNKDELIFTANWSDPQYLIGVNPDNHYFVAMDPVYMWHKNKELYQQYRLVALGADKDPYATLQNVFKVRYGYAGKIYFWALIEQVRNDERFEIVMEDGLGIIFKLKTV